MKPAHIIMEPDVEVGTKTLTACGKRHKVKVLWEDVPRDHPLCRDCVDEVLDAVNETNEQVRFAGMAALRLNSAVESVMSMLAAPTVMTDMVERSYEYASERDERAARENAKSCSCLWSGIDDRILDEHCPVHGIVDEEDAEEGK